MKDPNAEFFYCDECNNFEYGMTDSFSIVVRMSAKCYYIKSYTRGWVRNVLKDRFSSYSAAMIFGMMNGLNMKSKKDFELGYVEHEFTHEKIPRLFLKNNL